MDVVPTYSRLQAQIESCEAEIVGWKIKNRNTRWVRIDRNVDKNRKEKKKWSVEINVF